MEYYFAALDEIWMLRRALAYEATVVEAQTSGVSQLGKGRTEHLRKSVQRMRATARGEGRVAYAGTSSLSLDHAARRAEMDSLLMTRAMWEASVVRRPGFRPPAEAS